jgi:hypothetical protein
VWRSLHAIARGDWTVAPLERAGLLNTIYVAFSIPDCTLSGLILAWHVASVKIKSPETLFVQVQNNFYFVLCTPHCSHNKIEGCKDWNYFRVWKAQQPPRYLLQFRPPLPA